MNLDKIKYKERSQNLALVTPTWRIACRMNTKCVIFLAMLIALFLFPAEVPLICAAPTAN